MEPDNIFEIKCTRVVVGPWAKWMIDYVSESPGHRDGLFVPERDAPFASSVLEAVEDKAVSGFAGIVVTNSIVAIDSFEMLYAKHGKPVRFFLADKTEDGEVDLTEITGKLAVYWDTVLPTLAVLKETRHYLNNPEPDVPCGEESPGQADDLSEEAEKTSGRAPCVTPSGDMRRLAEWTIGELVLSNGYRLVNKDFRFEEALKEVRHTVEAYLKVAKECIGYDPDHEELGKINEFVSGTLARWYPSQASKNSSSHDREAS